MKPVIKNYLKLGMLLFGVSLLLWNCNSDNENKKQSDIALKYISLKKIKKKVVLKKLIANIEKTNEFKKNIIANDSTFTIITENILEATNADNITNYSFIIVRPNNDNNEIENFIITQENDQYTYFILKYDIDGTLISSTTVNEDLISQNILDFLTKLQTLDDCIEVSYEPCDGIRIADGHESEEGYCHGSATILDFSDCFSTGGNGGNPYYMGNGNNGDDDGYSNDNNNNYNSDNNYNPHGNSTPTGSVAINVCKHCDFSSIGETPCQNLSKIIEPVSISSKLGILKDHSNTTSPNEKGFKIYKNPLNNQYLPSGIQTGSDNGLDHFVKIVPTSYTILVVHTHPQEDVYAFFSAQDILYLARMANAIEASGSNNNINPVNLTMMLIVYGQTYAIRFDDIQSIQKLKDIYNDKDKRKDFKDKLLDDYEKDNNYMTGATSSISQQQNRLLTFLTNYNLNISIYQATESNDIIDGWEKFKEDGTKEPCN